MTILIIWSNGRHVTKGISTFVLVLMLSLIISEVSCGKERTSSAIASMNFTNCIDCDSLNEPICSNDTLLPIRTPYQKQCIPGETWCYKAEGNVQVVTHLGTHNIVFKVVRGCSKPRLKAVCNRVKQSDGTDFKICYCNTTYCNRVFSISRLPLVNPNSATWNGINSWMLIAVHILLSWIS